MTVRLIRVPFLIPSWADVQVLLPRTIFYRKGHLNERVLAHELRHVMQIREMGLLNYWWAYLADLIRGGYGNHPMEMEAHEAEGNRYYLEAARELYQAHLELPGKRILSVVLTKSL